MSIEILLYINFCNSSQELIAIIETKGSQKNIIRTRKFVQ